MKTQNTKRMATFIGLALAMAATPTIFAVDTYKLTITGEFDSITGSGHPDISIGDTFVYNVEFDDSGTLDGGTIFFITSVNSSELLVNGNPQATLPAHTIQINLDNAGSMVAAKMSVQSNAGFNRAYLNPTSIGAYPSAVGTTGEFADVLEFDGATASDFFVQGSSLSTHTVRGSGTITIVQTGLIDSDGDGLLDDDEINIHGTDPFNADTDGDGLTDGDEVNVHGTDPLVADTDGDGLSDGDEINVHSTDALNTDSDGDGLTDGDEVNGFGTDPNNPDTDGDDLSDADEINVHGTDPSSGDTDGDGLSDPDEINVHLTDPVNSDSDADGLNDGDEVNTHGTDPLNNDSDADGVDDGVEVNTLFSDPLNPDTDGDGLTDGHEVDITDSDPLNPDTDDDGLGDAEDPTPLDPGATSDWLEDELRCLAWSMRWTPLSEFNGHNNRANRGRRNALTVRLCLAANLVRIGWDDFAAFVLEGTLARIDGEPCPHDWMHAGPVQEQFEFDIELVIMLLGY